jgi:hypothetical protein
VFNGGSLELIANVAKNHVIIGIDSFEGLPQPSEHDTHKKGEFATANFEKMKDFFKGMNVYLVKGFSPDVFIRLDSKFAFVHIDVDLYQSVLDGCNFFFPRMVKGGIIIFDDYGFESTKGAKKAVNEFFADKEVTYKGELKYADGLSHKQYLVII